jgi:3alpha(or 20beta)-hydroxysteroid dehydrogenase
MSNEENFFNLSGKVAIVTGGARGIGAETARLLVTFGARVLIVDVSEDEGRAVTAELGQNAAFCYADVSIASDWKRIVAAAHVFGPISILINNAAVLLIAKLEETNVDDIERLFRTNQLGPILGIKAVMPDMMAAGAGSIVNTGSEDGLCGQDIGLSAYGSTKWALRGITKTAAFELGRHGIRVNCVHPSGGNPEMCAPFLPKGISAREGQIEHQHLVLEPPRGMPRHDGTRTAANMILFLASDASMGCTAGDYPVDGGYTSGHRLNLQFESRTNTPAVEAPGAERHGG